MKLKNIVESRRCSPDWVLQLLISSTNAKEMKGITWEFNLINIIFNTEAIEETLDSNPIEKIFFTSRFVEKRYRKIFKDLIAVIQR